METMAGENKILGRAARALTLMFFLSGIPVAAAPASAAQIPSPQEVTAQSPAKQAPAAQKSAAQKSADREHAAKKPATHKARAAKENTALAAARRRVLGAKPLALYYYVSDQRAQKSILAHASRMTVLAPQCYWVEKDGVLRGDLPSQVAVISRRARLPVMPLVFNRGFNRETVTALLHDPDAQQRAVSDMAERANRENLVGYQIDLENIDPADQALFTAFVRRAADRMHQDGRLLSVALVPKFTDVFPSVPTPDHPTMGEWAAAYDYRALGQIADFLTLMTYDHFNRSTPAGPIAGFDWVKQALDYAEARIPADKLLLGIPLYGREWTELGESTFSRSLDTATVRELRVKWKSKPQWDDRWQSPWFRVQHGNATRTVWYEDSRSWTEKLNLVRDQHLRGFAAWRLGFEGPNFWSMSAIKPVRAGKRGKSRVKAPPAQRAPVAKQNPAREGSAATSQ
jgi:spore germination protein YaaH